MRTNARICQARMRAAPGQFASRQLRFCAAIVIELLALGSWSLVLATGLLLLAAVP